MTQRIIKFRAWNENTEKMYHFSLENINGAGYGKDVVIYIEVTDAIPSRRLAVHGELVMQYTGLHDKNGKEIYEGDIVKNNIYKELEVVTFRYNTDGDGHIGSGWILDAFDDSDIEIIGNVYENPELLK